MVWGDIYMLSVRIIMLPVISLLDGIFFYVRGINIFQELSQSH